MCIRDSPRASRTSRRDARHAARTARMQQSRNVRCTRLSAPPAARLSLIHIYAEKLVMSLRVTGSETVERTEINPENAWENVFADGEIVRWLLKQDRRTQLSLIHI